MQVVPLWSVAADDRRCAGKLTLIAMKRQHWQPSRWRGACATAAAQLWAACAEYGRVETLAIIVDRYTRQSRCFAFVRFADADSARLLRCMPPVLDGRTLQPREPVSKSKTRKQSQFASVTASSSSSSSSSSSNNNNNNNASAPAGTKLHVAGLPLGVTDDSLRAYFERFGAVRGATVMLDCVSACARDFGYVTFKSPADCDKCLRRPHWIDGRRLKVG